MAAVIDYLCNDCDGKGRFPGDGPGGSGCSRFCRTCGGHGTLQSGHPKGRPIIPREYQPDYQLELRRVEAMERQAKALEILANKKL